MEEENSFDYFKDESIINALNAYCFVLQETLKSVAGLVDTMHTELAAEAIKAAKDIAFKYLGMKTEVARADIGNSALDGLIKKLTEEA